MLEKQKLDSPIPCHLTSDCAEAVKNFAFLEDVTPSCWVRNLIENEIKNKRLQAQRTLKALGNLANDENGANDFEGEE